MTTTTNDAAARYAHEISKLEGECAAVRGLNDAGNVETIFRSFLRLEKPRAFRAGAGGEFLTFERAVLARLARLRADWPTGLER